SQTWLSGWMRPISAAVSRSGKVTSTVSLASRASSAADLSRSRRAASACVTWSLARLMAAPCVLRSSGDILPSVASRAEIDPFLPNAATRTASRAASSLAAAMSARICCSSVASTDMTAVTCGSPLAVRHERPSSSAKADDPVTPRVIVLVGGYWMPRFSRGMTPDLPEAGAISNLGRERGFRLLGDRLERRRLVDREIREHLAVHRDARLGEAVDKSAVGQTERTHRGVQPLDPKRAERALLALAVAERILP